MEMEFIEWFEKAGYASYLLSLCLNILISVAGVLPSVFLTAANIHFFGFSEGVALSIAGEAMGAVVSFWLYRKGLKKIHFQSLQKNASLQKLQKASGREAFFLILGLRLFPFIPSGIVTLAGAGSTMSAGNFALSSTIGKIPALLLEAYSAQEVMEGSGEGKIILTIASLAFLVLWLFKKSNKKTE